MIINPLSIQDTPKPNWSSTNLCHAQATLRRASLGCCVGHGENISPFHVFLRQVEKGYPPGNWHIPPWENEHHLQTYLGWGYASSQESRAASQKKFGLCFFWDGMFSWTFYCNSLPDFQNDRKGSISTRDQTNKNFWKVFVGFPSCQLVPPMLVGLHIYI